MKIKDLWDVIPGQLAKENKKFTFSAIKVSARAREYEEAIQWLKAAGLIHLVNHVAKPAPPLKSYAEKNNFKIYFLDVGLLCAFANVPMSHAASNEQLLTEFKGALTENYVLQALIQRYQQPLFYWSSQGTAEIDFLIEHELAIYPLEVKAGASNKKKSLLVYQKKFNPPLISRTNALNFAKQEKLLNYPLYAISLFPERLL